MAAKKKPTAKKATAKKAIRRKAGAKKATANKKAAAKKPTVKAKKATVTKATATDARSTRDGVARRGDVIVIDSPQVGSPPREGEVLQVKVSEVSVSYLVRWADGHETLIAPKSGAARIIPASKK